MSSDRNKETQDSLKREIKAIQSKCVKTCQVIDNAPPEMPSNAEDTAFRINSYIEGLRTGILNSNTAFSTDENLLTSQFLIEMKKKTEQIEELVAFTKGNIHDTNAEINRIQTLIDIAKEAKSKPKITDVEVKQEHIQKAREKFQTMKATLHGLITSLFPDCHEPIIEVLGNLMTAKLSDNPNGYIPITAANYQLIELLKDMNIVTQNPYNNKEVKLTYY